MDAAVRPIGKRAVLARIVERSPLSHSVEMGPPGFEPGTNGL